MRKIIPFRVRFPDGIEYFCFQVPWLVHNPDCSEFPFHLYLEGHSNSGTNQPKEEEILFRSSDLITWHPYGVTHAATTGNGLTAYQVVSRANTGCWLSVGAADPINGRLGTTGIWSSADGLKFTLQKTINRSHGEFRYDRQGAPDVEIRGQPYAICIEHTSGKERFVSCVPVDAEGNLGPTSALPAIRISPAYVGSYPDQNHLHSISGYFEDGVYHLWAAHGFFADVGLTYGASNERGGGLDEQYLDYYAFVFDEEEAWAAAPNGVSAKCHDGVVELRWHDLTGRRHRVYRGEKKEQQSVLVAEVEGSTALDRPPLGRCWWYRVVPLKGDVEQKSRVISVYAGQHTSFTNHHIHRAITEGAAQQSISGPWIDEAVTWLRKNNLLDHLLFWTNPRFGYKPLEGAIEKIFDLGTTRLPRGGDCISYKAYADRGYSLPGVAQGLESNVFVYGGGRSNSIRRKTQLTFAAAYPASDSKRTLLRYGDLPSISLSHEGRRANFRISYRDPNPTSRLIRLSRLLVRALRNPTPYIRVLLGLKERRLPASGSALQTVRDKLARHSTGPRNYEIHVSVPVDEDTEVNVVAGIVDLNTMSAYADGRTTEIGLDGAVASDIARSHGNALLRSGNFPTSSVDLTQCLLNDYSILIFDTALSEVQLNSLSRLIQQQAHK